MKFFIIFLSLSLLWGCTINEPPYIIDENGRYVYRKNVIKESLPETTELPGVLNSKGEEVKLLLTYFVAPHYPEDAKASGIEGDVVVEFKIKADGTPQKVHIVTSDHPEIFDSIVLDVVQRWRFVPKKYLETYQLTLGFEL